MMTCSVLAGCITNYVFDMAKAMMEFDPGLYYNEHVTSPTKPVGTFMHLILS
uniref:Uncharacterized protein n=1 Tax=Nelumbo nucifera TaxID=4432 RepID=A0A822XG75_NELNU|nr:TPA_asm: hypothetical protein HUJ06_019298 [Nelumbo nucifera]DAD25704.1 TPA_asm: hypothetical protein HUJ06_027168 [Nelumbo nucifera]